ncbi:TlyA family RNA methyltransferase [Peptoniphilus indolicus]|uniref:Hemolysin A n=2 Tax=Peptoniphilus indolicus TaxID=33030 RepID=G4D6N4_9FIRM|nr:TlyA family RNA methyltransferase [Peptoniphilus indolicus]EGY76428.1 hemolysin A [Peptoniphilus indolicus ATCC 29427]SUB76050.1 16S/23S rRNA (cytidine-2'-O)-methyltransferase TlyA [Peptoniphilus indolicus]
MAKVRADILLYETGGAESREKAKRLIMSGEVFIKTQRVEKPGQLVDEDSEIYVKSKGIKYVSRGGFKLEKAIELYDIDLKDSICADIGASTGGFTHCMLLNGAKKVYAIDVGTNQLDYKLRVDERVVSMEKTNFRTFDVNSIEKVDFVSIDVSFISLDLILPNVYKVLKDVGEVVALIKPQFEAGKDKVGKKGIVKDIKVHKEVIEKVIEITKTLNFRIKGITASPIRGTTGNKEFLIYLEKSSEQSISFSVDDVVKEVE